MYPMNNLHKKTPLNDFDGRMGSDLDEKVYSQVLYLIFVCLFLNTFS